MNMKLLPDTPRNNEIYRLKGSEAVKVSALPAKWLVVVYNDDFAYLTEVFQKETSGMGFLKRTISNRRCQKRFKMFLHQRRKGACESPPKIFRKPFVYSRAAIKRKNMNIYKIEKEYLIRTYECDRNENLRR